MKFFVKTLIYLNNPWHKILGVCDRGLFTGHVNYPKLGEKALLLNTGLVFKKKLFGKDFILKILG